MLRHKSDFQARALVPELGKADLTDARTWIPPAAQGRGQGTSTEALRS